MQLTCVCFCFPFVLLVGDMLQQTHSLTLISHLNIEFTIRARKRALVILNKNAKYECTKNIKMEAPG